MEIKLQFEIGDRREQVENGLLNLLPIVFETVREEFENQLGRQIDLQINRPKDNELGSELLRISRGGKSNILVELVIPAPELKEEGLEKKISDLDWEGEDAVLTWNIIGILDSLIPRVLLAASISNPGVLTLWDGKMLVGEIELISSPVLYNSLIHDLEYGRNLGWPKGIEVSFREAYHWTSSILEQNECVSFSKVSRALAAYSHIAGKISYASGHFDLFWTMMGLESLYCEGEGIKRQLFDKASVVFGPLEENKKKIKNMYDHRSALLHGSIDIPYSFSEDIPEGTVDLFFENIKQSQSIACNLLISSLQFLVKHDLYDFEFTYGLIENKTRTKQLM